MKEMLEIREICRSPRQLFESKSFSRYLELYKKEFIAELGKRQDKDLKEELQLLRYPKRCHTFFWRLIERLPCKCSIS